MSDEGRVSARRAQTRRRLLDAALEAFAAVGVEAASVEQICERAGFTRGAFYSNFSSKDDLCIALLAEQRDIAHASALPALAVVEAPSGGLPDLMELAAEAFLQAQRTDRVWVLAINELRLHAARNPAVGEAYRAFARESSTYFNDLLAGILARTGQEFTVPMARAVDMLQAVWELSLLNGLVRGRQDEAADVRRNLATLLGALLA